MTLNVREKVPLSSHRLGQPLFFRFAPQEYVNKLPNENIEPNTVKISTQILRKSCFEDFMRRSDILIKL